MKVTLFKDIPQESWPSMERYAAALESGLQSHSPQLAIQSFSIPGPRGGLKILPFRFLVYPLLARFNQGEVNHVLDHSYGHLLYWLDQRRTVVTCHDLIPLEYEKEPFSRRIFKYSIGGLKRAARVIADSEATKKDLVGKAEIAAEKIRVIYLGVEKKFKVIKDRKILDAVRDKYQLPSGRLVLHVGNNLEYKNIPGLLKAFKMVLKKEPKARLVKVGSNFTDSQQALIKKLGISKAVVKLGFVAEQDLPAVYNLADVLVQPSFKEGFGFPVLEAMACGTPVVCSKVSSLPEVGGDAAIYCNPKDPSDIARATLEVLCSDVSKHQNRVREGLKQAGKFTWEECAQETVQVYQEVYEESRKR